jgi:hypothetical protein
MLIPIVSGEIRPEGTIWGNVLDALTAIFNKLIRGTAAPSLSSFACGASSAGQTFLAAVLDAALSVTRPRRHYVPLHSRVRVPITFLES